MIQDTPPVIWVDNPEDMMKFVKHVEDTKECAQDTETTGLNRHSDHVLFWSASPDENSRYCFSREMLEIFDAELTQNPDISWYYTNQTFDWCMLKNSGVRAPVGNSYCTLAMDWLSDENRMGRHGLKETAWDYLGLNMSDFKEIFKGRKRDESIQDRLLRAMKDDFVKSISYAAADAWATFRVFKHLKKKLENSYNLEGEPLWNHFVDIEMPFTRVLYNCCRRGIMVDVGYLGELGPRIQEDMVRIKRKINKVAGREVNLNSTPQMRDFLFEKLKLKVIKKTKGGQSGVQQPSTDATCLARWSEQGVEEVDWIITYRDLAKKYGTYVKGLLKWTDGDYRIHPTMTQHVAVTGRLSSVDPNLQNIPRPGTDKFGIRSAFMPKDGHIFIVVDYAQLEMRLMAHYSQDENMIGVIKKGWDIHTGTASLMFNHKYEEIIAAINKKKAAAKDPSITMTDLEKEMCFSRQASKNIGFGQHTGRSKTCSKRGNLSAWHKAIPCCAARRSVSTCDHRQMILNEVPVSIRSGSHSRKFSLTRQAKRIVFGVWQRQRSNVSTARRRSSELATVRSAARLAAERTTFVRATSAGIAPTRRRATAKLALTTTTGAVEALLSTTRRWPVQPTGTVASAVTSPQYWFTTRTETGRTVIRPTSSHSANAVTRLRCTTAPRTCPNSPRRYSQRPVKAGNYVLNYGEGIAKLANTLGVTQERAKELKEQYFQPYPRVREFIDGTHQFIRDEFCVSTILGRLRRFPEMETLGGIPWWKLRGNQRAAVAQAERQSVNSVIQGSAADVAKKAMILCDEDPKLRDMGCELLLQVHDELVFECPEETAREAQPVINNHMEHPFSEELLVPLSVDSGMGYAWSEAKS